jgi:2-hydroxymuconate-semialdehyde hydrolase
MRRRGRGRSVATVTRTRQQLLAGLGATERRVRVAGVDTALLEAGAGPPLILLHGGIECGGVYWAPAIARLAAHHRLVVPDVPGLGESEPVARLDAGAFDGWFAELVRATCDEPPALIAHSLLGSFAARFAAGRGELLRSLAICAAPGVGPYRMPLGLRAVAIRFALRPSERNAERLQRWAFFDLDAARRRDAAWLDAFAAYLRARAAVPHVKRTMRQLIGAGTTRIPDAELRRIPVPATLVWGRHDRFVPLALGAAAGQRLGWPLRVIDDAGHVPHIERPDAFVSASAPSLESPAR